MARTSDKGIDYYLGLEYPYIVVKDADEYFVQFPGLPGCVTQVELASDIHSMAQEIKELWLETALEAGQYIPEPKSDEYSGKFLIRVPKSLHRDLALQAKLEGMSLNSLVLHLLSESSSLARVEALMKKLVPTFPPPRRKQYRKTSYTIASVSKVLDWNGIWADSGRTGRPSRTKRTHATSYDMVSNDLSRFLVHQESEARLAENQKESAK